MSRRPERILMLSTGRLNMKQADHYLMNRGWHLRLSATPQDLLSDMAQAPVRFVFINVESGAGGHALAQILRKHYHCETIFYSETNSIAALSQLKNVSDQPQLNGRASGPSIERLLITLERNRAETGFDSPGIDYWNVQQSGKSGSLSSLATIKNHLRRKLDQGNGQIDRRIERVSKIECMVVYVERGCEIFLYAFPESLIDREEASFRIQNAILETFLSQGLVPRDHSCFTIEASGVDFRLWSRSASQQFLQTNHRGDEIILAVLNRPELLAEMTEQSHPQYAQVPIEHFRGDETRDYALYVFLPSSKKLSVLVPGHRPLSEHALQVLEKNLVKHLYVEKDDRHRERQRVLQRALSREFYETGHAEAAA